MKAAAYPLLSLLLSLSHLAAAISIDCENIRVDGKKFDLSKLAGRHSVSVHDTSRPPAEYNTTWTVNLCAPLKKLEGIRDQDQCPAGTRGKSPDSADSFDGTSGGYKVKEANAGCDV
jgi:hypothetical protein